MLYLKEINFDDIEKEYLFVRDIPFDENGFMNQWHGLHIYPFCKLLHIFLPFQFFTITDSL